MRLTVPVALALTCAAACSGGGGDGATPTSSTVAGSGTTTVESTTPTTEPSPTTTLDRGSPRTVTTPPVALQPGNARIVGNVTGPGGPVTGAIVKVERFVGSEVAATEVRTQDGRWELASIMGGTYRVTVFRPPDLAQLAPDTFFLRADETKTLDTELVRLGESSITATVDPNPPLVGQPAVVTVRFGSASVGAGGQVVTSPTPGVRVQLNVGSGIGLESSPVVVSDGSGAASWQVRCLLPGQFPASIVVDNASSSLLLPPCTNATEPAPAGGGPS